MTDYHIKDYSNKYTNIYNQDSYKNQTQTQKDTYKHLLNKNQNHLQFSSINDNQMTSLEREAFEMIKSQKEKIEELVKEQERKDKLISSLSKKEMSNDQDKIIIESLNRELIIIKDKLKLQIENEKMQMSAFSERLSECIESENKYKQRLYNKDKQIYELESKVKEISHELKERVNQVKERENLIDEMRSDISEINSEFKSLTSKFYMKEEEVIRLKDENKRIEKGLMIENKELNDRAEQLIEIMKEQSRELNDCQSKIRGLTEMNQSISIMNEKMNEELIEKGKEMNRLELKNRHFESLLKEKTDLLSYEKVQLNQIRHEFDKLNKKFSGIEVEKEVFTKQKDEIVSYVNTEIEAILQWTDTYLGVLFENSYEVPSLPKFSQFQYEQVNQISHFQFEDLKDCLTNVRMRINDEIDKIRKENNSLKHELEENLLEKEKVNTERMNLKTEVIHLRGENIEMNRNFESLQRTVNNQDAILHQVNISNEQEEKMILMMENLNKQVFELNKKCNLIGYEEYKKISGNNKINELYATITKKLNQIEEFIQNNIKKNQEKMNSYQNNHQNQIENMEKVEFLKEKYEKAMKEMTLKEMQIKNQEEMINRRELDLDEIKKELIDERIEKEKVKKDNYNLISLNIELSDRLKSNHFVN